MDTTYVSGSNTSKAAADSMRQGSAVQRLRVLQAIRDAGIHGKTREELEHTTGLTGNAIRPRCAELIERGLIAPSDEIRKTASGRHAEVLVAL